MRMNLTDLFGALHGLTYVLDGISGTFRHTAEWVPLKGGTGYLRHRLRHEPDAAGRRTVQYQDIRYMLEDDWTTDLTDSPDVYLRIAEELGLHGNCAECGEPVKHPVMAYGETYHEWDTPQA
jgi:hypothetical protein